MRLSGRAVALLLSTLPFPFSNFAVKCNENKTKALYVDHKSKGHTEGQTQGQIQVGEGHACTTKSNPALSFSLPFIRQQFSGELLSLLPICVFPFTSYETREIGKKI